MQTFLDSWVHASAHQAHAMVGKPLEALMRREGLETDLDLARFFVGKINKEAPPAAPFTRTQEAGAPDWLGRVSMRAPMVVAEAVEPFLHAKEGTLAIQLDRNLAALFSDAKIHDREDQFMAFVCGFEAVYVDLPRHAFRFSKTMELRGLILKWKEDRLIVYSAFSEEGKSEQRWPEGLVEVFFAWGERTAYYTTEIEDAEFQVKNLTERIEDLVRLAVLYYKSESESRRTAETTGHHAEYEEVMEPVPHADNEQLRKLSDKKRKSREKTHSLFRIVRLRAPAGKFERKQPEAPRGGWQLGVRVEVDAYFRMQPYGTRKALRRLQIIKGYVKNPQGEKQQDMFRLEPKETFS